MAAPDTNNPYAAPSDLSTPNNGPSHQWWIDGVRLVVAHGAVLPKIDLETGSEDPSLEEVRRKFAKAHWSMALMGIGPVVFKFVPKAPQWREDFPLWSIPGVYFGTWLIIGFVIFFTLTRRVTFTTYTNRETEIRRKRNRNIRIALYFLSFAALISPVGFVFSGSTGIQFADFDGLLFAGLIGVIATTFWQYYDRPKIHMTLAGDGWVKLKGVHFNAIRRLETWNSQPPEIS
jgi:hypothetical protein